MANLNYQLFTNSQAEISSITFNNVDSQHKSLEDLTNQKMNSDNFFIKINGPDQTQQSTEKYFQKVNSPIVQIKEMPEKEEISFDETVTGYDFNKDALNEEEIVKAFEILDVNKDKVITKEDLIFMLDIIKLNYRQDYTHEEVDEMINMLSVDKKQVTLQDFKKLGKAEIFPLANEKQPDYKWKDKAAILQNIQKTELISIKPEYVKDKLMNGIITYSKYEEVKNNPNRAAQVEETYNAEIQFLKLTKKLPLKTQQQFEERKGKFQNYNFISIDIAEKNYQMMEDRDINHQEIGALLEIDEKATRNLYTYPMQNSLFVLIEAIVYSHLKKITKLEKCLQVLNQKSTVSFKEFLHLLMLIKGKDQSIEKKLIAILKSKKIKFDNEIDKMEAVQLVREYISVF